MKLTLTIHAKFKSTLGTFSEFILATGGKTPEQIVVTINASLKWCALLVVSIWLVGFIFGYNTRAKAYWTFCAALIFFDKLESKN